MPLKYKSGLVSALLFRAWSICSDYASFHEQVTFLQKILSWNGYASSFIDSCVKTFLDNRFCTKDVVSTVEKCPVVVVLPFLGSSSYNLRRKISSAISNTFPQINLKLVFTSKNKISNLFRFKDQIPFALRSGVVYRFSCGNCHVAYVGKTSRHLHTRACEHLGISDRTGRAISRKNLDSAVFEHVSLCNYVASINDFEILASCKSDFELLICESLFIKNTKPKLNIHTASFPLELF
jgi:hypothetical protein